MSDMEKIGLVGGGFQHAFSSTLWKKPKHFVFAKNVCLPTTFFVDWGIMQNLGRHSCQNQIAWVLESRDVHPGLTEKIINNYKQISEEYEILFTHDKNVYDLADNFIYTPSHGYWAEEPEIYKKTKLVSMVSSNKRMTKGHIHRLEWVNKLKDKVDLYGRGFEEVEKKEEALKDYMFSVTIENDSYLTYWTEKILDCFVTGTVPVYYGSPDIFDFFNEDGIILLNEDFDVASLNEEEYYKRMDAIEDNFNRALKYDVIEDIIYEKWLK
jgi:hypothetical protein